MLAEEGAQGAGDEQDQDPPRRDPPGHFLVPLPHFMFPSQHADMEHFYYSELKRRMSQRSFTYLNANPVQQPHPAGQVAAAQGAWVGGGGFTVGSAMGLAVVVAVGLAVGMAVGMAARTTHPRTRWPTPDGPCRCTSSSRRVGSGCS